MPHKYVMVEAGRQQQKDNLIQGIADFKTLYVFLLNKKDADLIPVIVTGYTHNCVRYREVNDPSNASTTDPRNLIPIPNGLDLTTKLFRVI